MFRNVFTWAALMTGGMGAIAPVQAQYPPPRIYFPPVVLPRPTQPFDDLSRLAPIAPLPTLQPWPAPQFPVPRDLFPQAAPVQPALPLPQPLLPPAIPYR